MTINSQQLIDAIKEMESRSIHLKAIALIPIAEADAPDFPLVLLTQEGKADLGLVCRITATLSVRLEEFSKMATSLIQQCFKDSTEKLKTVAQELMSRGSDVTGGDPGKSNSDTGTSPTNA